MSAITGQPDIENLKGLTKPELAALCKSRQLKVSGTKDELIQRLCPNAVIEVKPKESKPKESKPKKTTTETTTNEALTKEVKPKKPTTKAGKAEAKSEDIVKRLVQVELPTIQLRRNKHGHCVHMDTQLVFNIETRRAYGKQKEDGTVEPLTDEDIETCKKYKFAYVVPSNLDRNKSDLKSVTVEELNEDDIDEEEVVEDKDDNEQDDEDEEEEDDDFEEEPEDIDEMEEETNEF